MREKVHFINVLKVVCFGLIFYYHSIIEAQMRFIITASNTSLYMNSNSHIATCAVALFFMLSGMGLMLSMGRNDRIDLLAYYKKRVVRIMVPYWICTLIFFVVLFNCHLNEAVPKWMLIFNVIGMDGYLSMFGIGTMYMCVGEWFLGCLLIMYIFFPLFHRWMKRKPKLFMIIATVIYLFISMLYFTGHSFFRTVDFTNVFIKMYEFILGMYLATVWKRIEKKHFLMAIIVVLLFWFLPFSVAIPDAVKITLYALSVFVVFAYLESTFDRMPRLCRASDICCKYSYETYLVHHGVILFVLNKLWPRNWFGTNVIAAIIAQIVLTMISGVILYELSTFCIKLSKTIRKRRRAKK